MEFSFDKSKSQQVNKNTSTEAAKDPFADARSQHLKNASLAEAEIADIQSAEKLAEERLRKAIERNRLKQQMKSAAPTSAPNPNPTSSASMQSARPSPDEKMQAELRGQQVQPRETHVQNNLFAREAAPVAEEARARARIVRSEVLNAEKTTGPIGGQSEIPQNDLFEKKINAKMPVVTRQRVAKQDEVEFTTAVKKVPRKVTTPAYATKKKQDLDPKWLKILVRGSWGFCALMLVRLFFSQGGVIDFYGQARVLREKNLELEQIKSENLAISKEISRMQTDLSYQKKIVRDNLGFIAGDEYLILFPKEI